MMIERSLTYADLAKAKEVICAERRTTLAGIQDDDYYDHPSLQDIWERAKADVAATRRASANE